MKKNLVFTTNNAHKLEEIRAILGDKINILSLNDIDCHADIPETADTLEGNARLKAECRYIRRQCPPESRIHLSELRNGLFCR